MITRKVVTNAVPVLFGAVIGANAITMSLMNFFETSAKYVSIFYFGSLAFTLYLIWRSGVCFPQLKKTQHVFCVLFGLVIFLPRAPYLIEGLLGYSVNPVGDDILHVQEMASIIHTQSFPPRSTLDDRMYLSYYYAPWMLGAALYWTGLLSTVKQALGATVLIYSIFVCYFGVYAAEILFAERKVKNWFAALCFLYGGFDFVYWVSGLNLTPTHSEWWATEFGFGLQYSNFFTLALWVQQHLLSALAIFYGLHVLSVSKTTTGQALAGIFLVSALFSSVFTTIGAALILAWFIFRFRLVRCIPVITLTSLLLSAPLLWMFMAKSAGVGFQPFGELNNFWIDHKRAAFIVFLLVISLELMPLLAGAFYSSRNDRSRLWLFTSASLYLLSTFFFAFSGANNFAMRGAIVPTFTLAYLSAPTFDMWWRSQGGAWLRVATVVYLLGGTLEYASFLRNSIIGLRQSITVFNAKVLEFNRGSGTVGIADLAALASEDSAEWYLLERDRPRKRRLEEMDLEIMNQDNRYRFTLHKILATVESVSRRTP